MTARASDRIAISLPDWGLIGILAVFWGSSFVLAKIAVFEIPAVTLTFVRVAASSMLLWPFIRALGYRLPDTPRGWLRLLPLAIFNNVIPFTLMYWAQLYIPSGLGAILNATTPFFAIILAALVLADERMTPGRLVGVVVGFAGVVVMVGPEVLNALGTDVVAQGVALIAAFCFAVGGVYGRGRGLRSQPPLVLATGQLIISTIVIAPLSALIDQPWTLPVPSAAAIWATVALTLLATLLAYVLFFILLKRVGATNVLLVTFLQPMVAIILAWFAFGERLTGSQVVGVTGILIGLAAVDGRPARMIANAFGMRGREGGV